MAQQNDKSTPLHGENQGSSWETGGSHAGNGGSSPSSGGHSGNGNSTQAQSSPGQFASGTTQFLLPKEQVHPEQKPTDHRRWWRRWRLWLALAALAILAIVVVYHFRSVAEANSAGAKAKQQEQAGAAITVGQSKTGDMKYLRQCPGHCYAHLHRYALQPDHRPSDRGPLSRRPDGEQRRSADRHRSSPLRNHPHTSRRNPGARSRIAGGSGHGFEPLQSRRRPKRHRPAAIRRSGADRRPGQRHRQSGRGHGGLR